MRRVGGLRERFLDFANLYDAFRKAFRATRSEESYCFYLELDRMLQTLRGELAEGSYQPGTYRYFILREPKERIISVAPFRDRVVHHALINILEPIYERRFVFDSYATRKGKGTHRAVARAQRFLRRHPWYLKMDVRKYFPSIDHEILHRVLSRTIKDRFILELLGRIIDLGGDGHRGLPIGNLTSQFFGNVYLDPFDRFVKQDLRVTSYLRYMDDFCLFGDTPAALKDLREECTNFLGEKLMLSVKSEATLINTHIHGLPFLGRRIYPRLVRLKRESLVRSARKLRRRECEYEEGLISYARYQASTQSLISHLGTARATVVRRHPGMRASS